MGDPIALVTPVLFAPAITRTKSKPPGLLTGLPSSRSSVHSSPTAQSSAWPRSPKLFSWTLENSWTASCFECSLYCLFLKDILRYPKNSTATIRLSKGSCFLCIADSLSFRSQLKCLFPERASWPPHLPSHQLLRLPRQFTPSLR